MQTAPFAPESQVPKCPRPHLSFCACKTGCLASELLVSMGPSPHLWFLHANSDICTRITSPWVSQTSPVVLCMQNRVPSIGITSLNGSQPSSVDFACKTETSRGELQVSMGPRPHLSLCACKPSSLAPELQVSMIPRPHLSFYTCKTETFGPELQVSMGPRPHLSFCACKTAWLSPEILVSMGPSPHLWFLHANSDICTRITSP